MSISFDNAVDGGINFGGTTQSWTHACGANSNSTGLLLVYCYGDSVTNTSTSLTGVTYNGVVMTQYGAPIAVPSDRWFYLFYLYGPSTGSNTVTINASTSIVLAGQSVSYLGVLQNSFPDALTSNLSGGSTTLSSPVTTQAPNSWVLLCGKNTSFTPTITTGTQRLSSSDNLCSGDSNGGLSSGTTETLVMTNNGTTVCGVYSFSIAPALEITRSTASAFPLSNSTSTYPICYHWISR